MRNQRASNPARQRSEPVRNVNKYDQGDNGGKRADTHRLEFDSSQE